MRLIAKVIQVILQASFTDSLYNLLISLTYEIDSQLFPELFACLALISQHFPKYGRVTICREQSRVGNSKRNICSTLRHFERLLMKIALIESVGDQFHRSLCHSLKLLLDKRGHCHHCSGFIQHLSFHLLMPSLSHAGHSQVLEIEYLGPRVTEVGNPRKTCLTRQLECYQMH